MTPRLAMGCAWAVLGSLPVWLLVAWLLVGAR